MIEEACNLIREPVRHSQLHLQSNWLSPFEDITEEPDFSQTSGFCGIIKNTVMHHF